MPFERFIPLCSIDPSDPQSSSSRRCIAYLDGGRQCGSLIPEHDLAAAMKIQIQYDASIGSEREVNLAKLAKLYLRSEAGHNTDGNVKAAVQQWMQTKWLIDRRVARSISPYDSEISGINTSTDENRVFKFSLTNESKKAYDNATYTNILLKNILKNSLKPTTKSNEGYVYIMTLPAAPGFARILRTANGSNPLPHQKCYPGWKLHCCIHCPNPKIVEKLVLQELADRSRVHECEGSRCNTHTKWIEAAAERLEESIRAWAELVEICYTDDTMITTMEEHLPKDEFSKEEDRWLKWAKKTAELLKVPSTSASPLPLSLPLRPAPIAQEPSKTSFITSASTTFSEAPHSVTPCTPPEIHAGSVTPPENATSQAPDSSSSRPHFTDWAKGKFGSIFKPRELQKPEGSAGRRTSEVPNLIKGFARPSRTSL
ncbi:hypothetical protein BDW71DRAFT_183144 [Aspergillus fruticulosus]